MSFAGDHVDRLMRRTRPRDALASLTGRLRPSEQPLHEVVASLSARLLDLPSANVGQGIDEALRQMGESLPADRVTLYLRTADATSYAEIARHSQQPGDGIRASDPDVLATQTGIEVFTLAEYPFLATQLSKAESLLLRSVDDLPAEALVERALFRDPRTASLLFVPMVSHGALVGFLQVEALGAPRRWAPEAPALVRIVVDMLTNLLERKRSQEKLAQIEDRLQTTQRLEIVGRLASGIAHDFNNFLTAILGYGELLSYEFDGDPRGHEEIGEIRNAAERASGLVEQILGISRAKNHDSKVLDLNSVLATLAKIVDRVAGDDVNVAYSFGADLASARVDPANFDQLILNLVTNARDAMSPEGGLLTIATNAARVASGTKVGLDVGRESGPLEVQPPVGLAPGDYVVMSVLDTGAGMTEETRTRLFEPFYTTKRRGRGTGIGLSSVAGIVEGGEGAIAVESELGSGSAFHVFLPVASESAVSIERTAAQPDLATGNGETLLLVEPEPLVRGLMERVLGNGGYSVLCAKDGKEAIGICKDHKGPIHLLIANLSMPRLCGREIAQQISNARPSVRVLFTSQYSEQALREKGVWNSPATVVEKPFAVHVLVDQVRAALQTD